MPGEENWDYTRNLATNFVNYGLERSMGRLTGVDTEKKSFQTLADVNPWELVMKDMKLPGFPKSAEDEFKTQPATGPKEQQSMMDNLFGSIDSIISMGVGAVAGVAKAVAGSIGSTFESVINYADHGIYEDDAAMRSRKVAALEDKISGLMDNFNTDKRAVTDAKLAEAMAMADELGIDASGLGKEIAAKRSALAAELASRSAASDTGAGGSSSTAPMLYTDALVASGAANGVDQMVTYDYKAVQRPGMIESLLFTQMYAGEGPTVTIGDTTGSQTSNLSYTQAMLASGAVSDTGVSNYMQAIEKGGGYSLNADRPTSSIMTLINTAKDVFVDNPLEIAKGYYNAGKSLYDFANPIIENVTNTVDNAVNTAISYFPENEQYCYTIGMSGTAGGGWFGTRAQGGAGYYVERDESSNSTLFNLAASSLMIPGINVIGANYIENHIKDIGVYTSVEATAAGIVSLIPGYFSLNTDIGLFKNSEALNGQYIVAGGSGSISPYNAGIDCNFSTDGSYIGSVISVGFASPWNVSYGEGHFGTGTGAKYGVRDFIKTNV